jgi:hypothetical protein
MSVNPLRNEVKFTVGGVKAFAVLKMDPLVRLSDSLGNPAFGEILRRINVAEPRALASFIELMTVDTDVEAIKEQMSVHVSAWQEVQLAALELFKPFLAETSPKKE